MDFELIFIWLVGIIAALCVVFIGFLIYDGLTSEKLTLTARDWKCTVSEQETVLHTQMVGNTTMMIPQTYEVCQVYERIK